MKKLFSFLLILTLMIGLCLALTGCDQPSVSVSSLLEIDDGFAGTRTVTAVYPLSVKIDALKDRIIADDPTAEIDGAAFSYVGVEEDGYHFELKLTFADKQAYEEIVGELIGRGTTVFLSRKDTFLTQGTRMAEDFDVSELIAWVVSDTAASDEAKNLRFDYADSTVKIGTDTYATASTVSVNECEGSAVNTIAIKTSNDKEDSYDRTFVFTIPNSTYVSDKDAIESYFQANTLPDAGYAGWTSEGSNMVYTVIYEDLDIAAMAEVTSLLLDTDSTEIFYGDRDNASTPLSEGLTFEENIDTFSFIGSDSSFPTLLYSYSLPLNTTYGEGSVFEGGRWVSAGTWTDDVYTVELTNGSAKLRIPDGIQYRISGINFSLESLGDARFRRSTDFIYDQSDRSAADYAASYFESKGVASESIEEDGVLTCHVAFEGGTEEITAQLVKVFGSGNFMAYEQKKGIFDLSIKTELTDYVNLGYMLNSENASCPMTYTVGSEGGENIVSVSVDGSEVPYDGQTEDTMTVKNGCATIQYRGNIPITSRIVLYIAVGLVLLIATAFICIRMMQPKKRRRYADPVNNPETVYDTEDAPAEAPSEDGAPSPSAASPLTQTTTFSIFELNALVRNKKYVDEINKDVEARMHAQSLEEQKQDIRARELENLSKKVYGEPAPEAQETDNSEEAADD